MFGESYNKSLALGNIGVYKKTINFYGIYRQYRENNDTIIKTTQISMQIKK
jgi:hypothetical protein